MDDSASGGIFSRVKQWVREYNKINPHIITYVLYGIFYETFVKLYKPFAVKFLERVGGNEFHISMYNSLPGLLAIFAIIPGTIAISKRDDNKKSMAAFLVLSRFFILCAAFVPLFPKEWQPMLFVISIALFTFPEAIFQCAFSAYLGDVFPGEDKVVAISMKNRFANIQSLLVTLLSGVAISVIPKTPEQVIICYQIFYVLAFIFGLLEFGTLLKMDVADGVRKEKEVLRPRDFLETFKHKDFRLYLFSTLFFYFTWVLGWPVTSVFHVLELGANELWLAAFSVVSGIASFISSKYWNRIIDKHGDYFAMAVAAFTMATNMFFQAISPNLWVVLIINIGSGISVVGFTITLLNGLLGYTPDKKRSAYVGVFHTTNYIAQAVAPLLSLYYMNRYPIRDVLMIVFGYRTVGTIIIFLFAFRERRRHIKNQNNKNKS